MIQSVFSEQTLKYLESYHSEFLKNVNFKEDFSFDCFIQSNLGNAILWISTYDCEITIGLDNSEKKCSWHIHIGASNGENQKEELNEMSKILNEIINNHQVFILDNNEYLPLEEGENVENFERFYYWNEI